MENEFVALHNGESLEVYRTGKHVEIQTKLPVSVSLALSVQDAH